MINFLKKRKTSYKDPTLSKFYSNYEKINKAKEKEKYRDFIFYTVEIITYLPSCFKSLPATVRKNVVEDILYVCKCYSILGAEKELKHIIRILNSCGASFDISRVKIIEEVINCLHLHKSFEESYIMDKLLNLGYDHDLINETISIALNLGIVRRKGNDELYFVDISLNDFLFK